MGERGSERKLHLLFFPLKFRKLLSGKKWKMFTFCSENRKYLLFPPLLVRLPLVLSLPHCRSHIYNRSSIQLPLPAHSFNRLPRYLGKPHLLPFPSRPPVFPSHGVDPAPGSRGRDPDTCMRRDWHRLLTCPVAPRIKGQALAHRRVQQQRLQEWLHRLPHRRRGERE